jgi:hypothetical protein
MLSWWGILFRFDRYIRQFREKMNELRQEVAGKKAKNLNP